MKETTVINTKILTHSALENSNSKAEVVTYAINEMDREFLEQINPSSWNLESIATRVYVSTYFPITMIEREYTICFTR